MTISTVTRVLTSTTTTTGCHWWGDMAELAIEPALLSSDAGRVRDPSDRPRGIGCWRVIGHMLASTCRDRKSSDACTATVWLVHARKAVIVDMQVWSRSHSNDGKHAIASVCVRSGDHHAPSQTFSQTNVLSGAITVTATVSLFRILLRHGFHVSSAHVYPPLSDEKVLDIAATIIQRSWRASGALAARRAARRAWKQCADEILLVPGRGQIFCSARDRFDEAVGSKRSDEFR